MKFIDKSLITSWREWGAAAFTEPVVVTGRDHFAFRALLPTRTVAAARRPQYWLSSQTLGYVPRVTHTVVEY